MTSPRIDSHHHLWTYTAEEYGWIGDSMEILRRDFRPEHLEEELADTGIAGAVAVQARQTLEETEWLLEIARAYPFIRGVVGWVPLIDPRLPDILGRYADHSKLKAVRHILQDEPDERFMLRKEFNQGISVLASVGLTYDILIFEHQLPQTIEFVDRHPNQRFVVDHLAKPRLRDGSVSPWKKHLNELSKRPNVFCKVSGLVTEGHWRRWAEADLRPYFDAALQSFGPGRLMFGSDWPVCLLACEYRRWFNIVRRAIGALSRDEQERILGGTAAEAYQLEGMEA